LNSETRQPGTLSLYIRSFLFWIVFASLIPIFALLLVLSFPFPLKKRFALTRLWSKMTIWWLDKTCNLRHEIVGLENITGTPGIVFAKHQSTWETLILNQWFTPQSWVLKKELLWVPFFGWGVYMMDPVALDRSAGKRAIKQLVEQGRKRLDDGRWIIVFPEGTRIAPGKRGRYRIGGAILAEQTGYPIIPLAHNAGEYWRRREFIKRPGTIQVHIGPPIESKNKTAQQLLNEAETWIESRMAIITTLDDHEHGPREADA